MELILISLYRIRSLPGGAHHAPPPVLCLFKNFVFDFLQGVAVGLKLALQYLAELVKGDGTAEFRLAFFRIVKLRELDKIILKENNEGFCWSEIKTFHIRCRLKQKTINSNKSMSFYQTNDIAPDYFIICLLNSYFIASYVNFFINNTQTFGVDDARQIPIVIPCKRQLEEFKHLFNVAITIKEKQFTNQFTTNEAENQLLAIQEKLDILTTELYGIV
jgi:hypothetical protein